MPKKAADGAPSRRPDSRPPRAAVAVHREFYAMSSGRVATTRCCDLSANPTGFGTVDQTNTLSEDGKTYHGEGPLQFFDNDGNPLGPATTLFDDGKRITFPE